jgi:hypothetical protein
MVSMRLIFGSFQTAFQCSSCWPPKWHLDLPGKIMVGLGYFTFCLPNYLPEIKTKLIMNSLTSSQIPLWWNSLIAMWICEHPASCAFYWSVLGWALNCSWRMACLKIWHFLLMLGYCLYTFRIHIIVFSVSTTD